jgi:regulator of protease activity HflC (stomatin/prohibitin superfamily)
MIGYVVFALGLVALVGVAMSVRVIKQYERVVLFELGRVKDGARGPGVIFIVPFVDRVHRVSLRIITMPIQSQGIITKDNVSIDVSAVAYYRVEDPIRPVIAIENVESAINQIAQTTLRAVVGRHTLDETLSETDTINLNIREILDVQTEEWGSRSQWSSCATFSCPTACNGRWHARPRPRPSAKSARRSSPHRARRSRPASWPTPPM